jgi:hypothetical protein
MKLESIYEPTVKKPTKVQAYDILSDHIAGLDAVTDKDKQRLTALFKYFMPETKGKAKSDPFAWVAQACSDDPTRIVLHYVHVEDGTMVATDGMRLHIASTNLKDGFYDTNGVRVKCDDTYPNWKAVVPKTDGCDAVPLCVHDLKPSKTFTTRRNRKRKQITTTKVNGATFDYSYLIEAMAMDSNATLFQADEFSPALLKLCGDRRAVVMSMRETV